MSPAFPGKKIYRYCEFPLCSNHSFNSRINSHHIIPKSKNGVDDAYNRFHCCPNCHNKIYIPGEKTGIHSNKLLGSIILEKKVDTTKGKALIFLDCDDDKTYIYYYDIKKKTEFLKEGELPYVRGT